MTIVWKLKEILKRWGRKQTSNGKHKKYGKIWNVISIKNQVSQQKWVLKKPISSDSGNRLSKQRIFHQCFKSPRSHLHTLSPQLYEAVPGHHRLIHTPSHHSMIFQGSSKLVPKNTLIRQSSKSPQCYLHILSPQSRPSMHWITG